MKSFKSLTTLRKKNGAIIVVITRLVPLFPFNLLNYGFGLTKVHFHTYVLWSALCMLPGTILYVVGNDAFVTAVQDGKIPWTLIAVVMIIFTVVTVLVRAAKGKLKE